MEIICQKSKRTVTVILSLCMIYLNKTFSNTVRRKIKTLLIALIECRETMGLYEIKIKFLIYNNNK